jgi:hypothetical protein
MDSVPTQEPAGSSLPDIHLDPPQQHSIPTAVYIFAGLLVSVAGAYLFLGQGFTFKQSTADLGTPPEEKMAAMAAVKASAEAEGRPKLSREEKMQFLGILDTGEATSSEVVPDSTTSTE